MTAYLGIKKFPLSAQALEQGDVYAVNCGLLKDAIHLCITAKKSLGESALVFVEDYDTLEDLDEEGYGEEDYEVLLYSEKRPLIYGVPDILRANLKSKQAFGIFLLTYPLEKIGNKEFAKAVQEIRETARKKNIGAILVFNDSNSRSLKNYLARESHALRGLGSVSPTQTGSLFYADFWRSEGGTIFAFGEEIRFTDGVFQGMGSKLAARMVSDDEGLYLLSEHCRFKNQLTLIENVQVYKDNEEVARAAEGKRNATVIFSVSSNEDVIPVAKNVFELRKNLGNDLKIFVIEEMQILRGSLEAVLMECGTNFIFQKSASISYVMTMLWQLKEEVFTRPIKKSWDDYQKSLEIISVRGYQEEEKFISLVRHGLASVDRAAEYHGALVILKTKPNVTKEAILRTFDPGRNGDIGTLMGDYFITFLWGCQASFLLEALPRVFSVPIKNLFTGYQVLFSDMEILDFMQEWSSEREIETPNLPPVNVNVGLAQKAPVEDEHFFAPKPGKFRRKGEGK